MRIAVYAGSFDPPTNGHLWVIQKASELFDSLIVVVADNPAKKPLFEPSERATMLTHIINEGLKLGNVTVSMTSGLVGDLAKFKNAKYFVRAARNELDVVPEYRLAELNRQYFPEMETITFYSPPEYGHISSTTVKTRAENGMDLSGFVPLGVANQLKQKFQKKNGVCHAP